jgi:hypothetical protein
LDSTRSNNSRTAPLGAYLSPSHPYTHARVSRIIFDQVLSSWRSRRHAVSSGREPHVDMQDRRRTACVPQRVHTSVPTPVSSRHVDCERAATGGVALEEHAMLSPRADVQPGMTRERSDSSDTLTASFLPSKIESCTYPRLPRPSAKSGMPASPARWPPYRVHASGYGLDMSQPHTARGERPRWRGVGTGGAR